MDAAQARRRRGEPALGRRDADRAEGHSLDFRRQGVLRRRAVRRRAEWIDRPARLAEPRSERDADLNAGDGGNTDADQLLSPHTRGGKKSIPTATHGHSDSGKRGRVGSNLLEWSGREEWRLRFPTDLL